MAIGTASPLSSGISSLGAAVGDLYDAEGYGHQADGYRAQAQGHRLQAGGYRFQADAFRDASRETVRQLDDTRTSFNLQRDQAERTIYKTLGGQQADITGAGLRLSGSGLDLMRDSAAQGDLTMNLISTQERIDTNVLQRQIQAYWTQGVAADISAQVAEQQALSADAQAEAADSAAEGQLWSAGFNAAASVVSFGSFFAG